MTAKQPEPKEIFDNETSARPNIQSKYDAWILHPKQIEKKLNKNPVKRVPLVSSICDHIKQGHSLNHGSHRNNRSMNNLSPNPKRKRQNPKPCVDENAEMRTADNQNAMETCNFDKKAWSIAHLPLKTMGMTFFMLYMSGSNAGIFSILVISYALVNAVKILIQANKNFLEIERAARKPFTIQKTVYCIYSLFGIAFVLFKLGTMGLIPVNRGDFFSDTPPHTFPTYAIGT
ncbi:multi-pass transmembrane [Cryptosporidium sp. chipmunk genotype I]|uniref:multi-pass transmembrane n=1 Tax=Cryptosporidium sp. chipmunk genotype I TaxID=1280935 RepID=UPI00351A6999|nr:multi-pass transmembrane [Cryptosporidium sp. chipmunk genotype I]